MKKLFVICAIALVPALASADKTFTGTKDGAWDCAKEPNVRIMRGQGTYTFKGACTAITVQGGNNKLTIESVDSLQITGGGNQITVGTLDSVAIVGANNSVTWKKAKSGDKPKSSAVGSDNKVNQGG
jgi:hypothetical protein